MFLPLKDFHSILVLYPPEAEEDYTDFYILDELWPDFKPGQFYRALDWYQTHDITLGG